MFIVTQDNETFVNCDFVKKFRIDGTTVYADSEKIAIYPTKETAGNALLDFLHVYGIYRDEADVAYVMPKGDCTERGDILKL